MKEIWIINPYGTIPGEAWREYRSTMLAKILADNGYFVRQWISDFEHRSKQYRKTDNASIQINERYTIEIVHTTPYDRHISIDRIKSEKRYAENFFQKAQTMTPPACIILADPALFYSGPVKRYLRKYRNTKLIVDIIDIWPELFAISLPKPLRPFHKLIFMPFYVRRARLLKQAHAVIAVAEDYKRLAAGITKNKIPLEVVYWGINFEELDNMNQRTCDLLETLRENKREEVWVLYAGTLGENYDIATIMEVAAKIEQEPDVRLILAGDGPMTELVTSTIERLQLTRTTFLGRVGPDVLADIYKQCDIAISSYKGESTVAMPIKAFDYFAGGLPVINSLKRDLGYFVAHKEVGLQYEAESAASMYQKIAELKSDRPRLKRMSENCRALAVEFDYKKQYQKIIPLLEKVLK